MAGDTILQTNNKWKIMAQELTLASAFLFDCIVCFGGGYLFRLNI